MSLLVGWRQFETCLGFQSITHSEHWQMDVEFHPAKFIGNKIPSNQVGHETKKDIWDEDLQFSFSCRIRGVGIETHTDGTCSGNEGQGVAPQTPPVHLQVMHFSRTNQQQAENLPTLGMLYPRHDLGWLISRVVVCRSRSNAVHIIIIGQECLAHSPKVWSPADCWASGKTWTQPCRGLVYNLAKLFVRLAN